MVKKSLTKGKFWTTVSITLLIGLLAGYYIPSSKMDVSKEFEAKSVEEMQMQIMSELSFATEKAEEEGKYACCIEAPCKSCLVDGGLHSKDGKICDCDEILEDGGTPCPECVKGLADGKRHTE